LIASSGNFLVTINLPQGERVAKFLILFQIVAQYTCKLPARQGQTHNYLNSFNNLKERERLNGDPVPGHVTGQGFYVSGKNFRRDVEG
jgi:hypothetical protein